MPFVIISNNIYFVDKYADIPFIFLFFSIFSLWYSAMKCFCFWYAWYELNRILQKQNMLNVTCVTPSTCLQVKMARLFISLLVR